MNHDEIQQIVFSVYDGEANTKEREIASAHLETCAECRTMLANWEKTAAQFFRGPTVPAGFTARVLGRINWEPPLRSIARWLVPAMGLALAGFASVIVAPVEESAGSPEAVMISQAESTVPSGWLLASDAPKEETLDYVLEGQ